MKSELTVPGPAAKNESVSVDVRKIDNGYVTRTSRWNGDSYSSKETYSKEKPQLEIEPSAAQVDPSEAAGRAAMSRAKDTLSRGR